jgi:hypothetical protein
MKPRVYNDGTGDGLREFQRLYHLEALFSLGGANPHSIVGVVRAARKDQAVAKFRAEMKSQGYEMKSLLGVRVQPVERSHGECVLAMGAL